MLARGSPEASEHLLYEVERLEELVHLIAAHTKEGATRDALIESFLVHARLIAQFLDWHRSPPWPDDMLAEHFVRWTANPPPPTITRATIDGINKRVAHLSYAREHASAGGDTWAFSGIAKPLLERVGEFVCAAMSAKPYPLSAGWNDWARRHHVGPGPRGPFKHTIPDGVAGATGPGAPASSGKS